MRADHYRYWYTTAGSEQARNGKWWERRKLGHYLQPVDVRSLTPFLQQQGWFSRGDTADTRAPPKRHKRV